MSEENSS